MPIVAVRPNRFEDERGWFSETWNAAKLSTLGICCDFSQDNHSLSRKAGTLRGLHFQAAPFAQAKLVRCIRGSIYDVAVDIRRDSPTFGRWVGVELSAENGKQLFIPVGFAHGFLTLEADTEVCYKVDNPYRPHFEYGLNWQDDGVGINWPSLTSAPILSKKDAELPCLADLEVGFPYDGRPLEAIHEIEM